MADFLELLLGNRIKGRLGRSKGVINGNWIYNSTRLLSKDLSDGKLALYFQYFHQVKSGTETQYRSGRVIATFSFPSRENFLLYGIRKFWRLDFCSSQFLDNPPTLFGTIFVSTSPNHPIGVYSIHFKSVTDCWIDFSKSSPHHYVYHNGSKPHRPEVGKLFWFE